MEKFLGAGIMLSLVWFIVLSLFVWELPKPKYVTNIEEEMWVVDIEKPVEDPIIKEEFIVNGLDKVTVTFYNPVAGQCNSSPLITADNSKIDLDELKRGNLKWVAVSRDLLKSGKIKYGEKIRVTCKEDSTLNGVYTVHDTMHSRWIKKIDILAHQETRSTGKYSNVEIEYLGEEG